MTRTEILDNALNINPDPRMTTDELAWLYDRFNEIYKGGNSIEIGAYRGMLSYICANVVAEKGGVHYIIDAFDTVIDEQENKDYSYGEHTEEGLLERIGKLSKHVKTIKGRSLDWASAQQVIDGSFDYCFIDGDHRDPIVYLELCLCKHSVKHILGHDYGWPGVTASVDRFCKENGYRIYQPLSGRGIFELIKE